MQGAVDERDDCVHLSRAEDRVPADSSADPAGLLTSHPISALLKMEKSLSFGKL